MKALLRSIVVAALLLIPALAKAQAPAIGPVEEDFTQTLSKATLEMYVGKQVCEYKPFQTMFGTVDGWTCKFVAKPICTATVIAHQDGTDIYGGVATGHCVVPELYQQGWEYYVGEDVRDNPVLDKIALAKWDNTDRYDYVVFSFKSLRQYPVIEMAHQDEDIPAIGTEVLNVNFSLGITKQVTEGKILSTRITADRAENKEGLVGRYFVNVGIGPGASGSAVVDKKTHKIVGLVEAVFPGTQMATLAVPMGKTFYDFVDDDSAGIPPQPPPNGEQFRLHQDQSKKTFTAMLSEYLKRQMKELGF